MSNTPCAQRGCANPVEARLYLPGGLVLVVCFDCAVAMQKFADYIGARVDVESVLVPATRA